MTSGTYQPSDHFSHNKPLSPACLQGPQNKYTVFMRAVYSLLPWRCQLGAIRWVRVVEEGSRAAECDRGEEGGEGGGGRSNQHHGSARRIQARHVIVRRK